MNLSMQRAGGDHVAAMSSVAPCCLQEGLPDLTPSVRFPGRPDPFVGGLST